MLPQGPDGFVDNHRNLARAIPAEVRGVLCGLGAAVIWGAWPVVSKIGVRDTLSAYDIAAVRFLVAGILLLPVVLRNREKVTSWRLAVGLAAGAGAPYTLVSVGGLVWAPASHGGIIGPSCSMIFSLLGGWLILSDMPSARRLLGVAILICGILFVAAGSLAAGHRQIDPGVWRGDLMFVAAGFLWAGYTVAFRRSGLPPLVATALVAVISMVIYVPIYLAVFGASLFHAPAQEIIVQAVFQGLFAAVIALLLHTAATAALGASKAAIFPGLAPAIAVAFSAVILGERLSIWEWAGIALVTIGMLIAIGIRIGVAKTRVADIPSRAALE